MPADAAPCVAIAYAEPSFYDSQKHQTILSRADSPAARALPGGVAERLKATVLKTVVRETAPGVRIPPPPCFSFENRWFSACFLSDFSGCC